MMKKSSVNFISNASLLLTNIEFHHEKLHIMKVWQSSQILCVHMPCQAWSQLLKLISTYGIACDNGVVMMFSLVFMH